MDNWVLTIISGTIGAIIGTYGGAFFLHYWQLTEANNSVSESLPSDKKEAEK